MKVLTYTPHGDIPNLRGFAPALAAQYLAQHLPCEHLHVCLNESHLAPRQHHATWGDIERITVSKAYKRVMQKIIGWDCYPMHRRLLKAAKAFEPDIVHAHQLEFPVKDFKQHYGKPCKVVVHAHAIRRFKPELGRADLYIAVADYTREQLIAHGYPPERIAVIHNGADTSLFEPVDRITQLATLRHELLGERHFQYVLGYIGRKQIPKGYGTFIQTLEALCAQRDDIIGLSVGPTPADAWVCKEYPDIVKRSEALQTQGKLVEMPAVTHDVLRRCYQAIDVLLFPTTTSGEQHPLVLIESLACANAIITSNIAGISETITHQQEAILLKEPTDVSEISQWVELIIANPKMYDPMRQAARKLAQQHYDWQALSKKLMALYTSCLQPPYTP